MSLNPERAAFIAGAQWADDQCPVHAYPTLLEREATKRYPDAAGQADGDTEPDAVAP